MNCIRRSQPSCCSTPERDSLKSGSAAAKVSRYSYMPWLGRSWEVLDTRNRKKINHVDGLARCCTGAVACRESGTGSTDACARRGGGCARSVDGLRFLTDH